MNVLIVDDKKEVVEGMLSGICWDRFGFENIYPCYSAYQARDIFRQHEIHILLADIEMPGENGLELFAWAKEQNPELKGVFLTAHAEFEYAKEAVRLGSFDYILLPARYQEIEILIQKVIYKIKEEQFKQEIYQKGESWKREEENLLDHQLHKLQQGTCSYISFLQMLQGCGLQVTESTVIQPVSIHMIDWKINTEEWGSRLIRFALNNLLTEILSSTYYQYYLFQTEKNNFLLLLYLQEGNKADQEDVLEIIHSFYDFYSAHFAQTAIYLSDTTLISELKEMLEFLDHADQNNVLLQSSIFNLSNNKELEVKMNLDFIDYQRIQDLLKKGYPEILMNELHKELESAAKKNLLDRALLGQIHQKITMAVFGMAEQMGNDPRQLFDDIDDYERYMKSYETLGSLEQNLKRILLKFNRPSDDGDLTYINLVKKYIKENLDKNISRDEIAEIVFLNSEYLSRLFKRETGYSLKDYIIREKLRTAKHLLVTTSLSISIIASKVGYENFSHFTYMFKKSEGMSPLEYRQCSKSLKIDN